jgi:adenine phosphoribosyltransferase
MALPAISPTLSPLVAPSAKKRFVAAGKFAPPGAGSASPADAAEAASPAATSRAQADKAARCPKPGEPLAWPVERPIPVAEPNPMDIKNHIRSIPDFPKPGILFYDISTLLAHADAWSVAMGRLAKSVSRHQPDLLAGIESRGFLVAAPLALKLGLGFVMVRKRGKLPGATIPYEYALEYGSDIIEIQADAVSAGQRVVVLDDLLATGGTMAAAINLLCSVGADVVGAATIIELSFLNGRKGLDVPFTSLVAYDS